MLPARFLLFGSRSLSKVDNSIDAPKRELVPTLKLQTDKNVYRPGDPIVVTIQINNPSSNDADDKPRSLFVEKLSFEIKGIEKFDTQWFATQKPLKGSKKKRGEHVFMDCSAPSMISNQIVSSGATKTYAVQTWFPSVIPPSYRGTTIRYMYYVKSTLSGRWMILGNGHSHSVSMQNRTELEARIPLQVWTTQKISGLLMEEGPNEGIVPITTIQMNIYWKEMDGDSDWTKANDICDGAEEGFDSLRDEISSDSSYNPVKESAHKTFENTLSLQSFAARSSFKEVSYLEGGRIGLSSIVVPPNLSVAEVLDDSIGGVLSPKKLPATHSLRLQRKLSNPLSADDAGDGRIIPPAPRAVEPAASEGFIRKRSYNIKLDDHILLRFSPKNSDSTYYFGDMIGGTLTFFHEGPRRCLEISITLEISETISQRFVHPSWRNSPTITKVQSDHHEVVADLVQTSFLFSIPMDGPMSFLTSLVSVQWALRFEFFTTPKNVDWTRYEHPLMIEGRDRTDWVVPITVHVPPPGASATHTKSLSLEPLSVRA